MATQKLRSEDYAGLALAVVLHAGLLGLLVLRPAPAPVISPPERISVTLSDETGLTSTSPQPQAAPAVASAPVMSPDPEPKPAPQPVAESKPQLRIIPQPTAVPAPAPRVATRPVAQPRVSAPPTPRAAPRPQPTPQPRMAQAPASTSRISSDFLNGLPAARTTGASRNIPAATIGPAVQSALSGAISRQLKPHWATPQGAEAEKLVSILAWSLNRDGTLAGIPRLVGQDGITDANRAQAARHGEQAIRAVQLAAPFNLPAEYFTAWQRVASFRFDRRLSQ